MPEYRFNKKTHQQTLLREIVSSVSPGRTKKPAPGPKLCLNIVKKTHHQPLGAFFGRRNMRRAFPPRDKG